MWQNETEQQNVQLFPPQPPLKDILRYKPGPHDTGVSPVLKTQVALCLLLLGVVLALRLLNLPVYEYFRQQYEQSLSQEGEFFREKELFALADGFLEGLRERAEGAVSAWEDRVQGEEAPDSIDGQG